MKVTTGSLNRTTKGKDYSYNTVVHNTSRTGKIRSTQSMTSTTRVYGKDNELLSVGKSTSSTSSFNVNSSFIGSAFSIIFASLILINLFNLLLDNTDFRGFEWLLNVLSNAPSVPIDWLENFSKFTIDVSSWGLFEPIGNFINLLSDILSTLLFICTGALNIIMFVLYFLKSFLFLGI